MLTVDDFLELVSAFCAGSGCSEGALSKRLFNDGKRIRFMREKNGDIGSRHLRNAIERLSADWPEGVEWPPRIERPAPVEKVA